MPDTAGLRKIELMYSLAGRDTGAASIRNALIDMLHAVREEGSIAAAATRWSFRTATCGAN